MGNEEASRGRASTRRRSDRGLRDDARDQGIGDDERLGASIGDLREGLTLGTIPLEWDRSSTG